MLPRGANELNIGVLGARRPPELLFLVANVTPPQLNPIAALEAGEVVWFKASVPLQGLMERPPIAAALRLADESLNTEPLRRSQSTGLTFSADANDAL